MGTVIVSKPIEAYLIEQSGNPSGVIGKIMMKIWNNAYENMSKWGLNKIEINEDDILLDVGFGGGETIYNLTPIITKGEVYGIDISQDAVISATEKNKEKVDEGVVKLLKGDVGYMDFQDSKFDIVTAMQTHIYWEEIERGVEEVYRVLKPNGTFLITCELNKIENIKVIIKWKYYLKVRDSKIFKFIKVEIG